MRSTKKTVIDMFNEASLKADEVNELLENDSLLEGFTFAIENIPEDAEVCDFIEVYDSVEQFGADNSNDVREEDDSDYDWGTFLVGAYGYAGNFAHVFASTGRVITAIAEI